MEAKLSIVPLVVIFLFASSTFAKREIINCKPGVNFFYNRDSLAIHRYPNNTLSVNIYFNDTQILIKDQNHLLKSFDTKILGIANISDPNYYNAELKDCRLFVMREKRTDRFGDEESLDASILGAVETCVNDKLCVTLGLIQEDDFIRAKMEPRDFGSLSVGSNMWTTSHPQTTTPQLSTSTPVQPVVSTSTKPIDVPYGTTKKIPTTHNTVKPTTHRTTMKPITHTATTKLTTVKSTHPTMMTTVTTTTISTARPTITTTTATVHPNTTTVEPTLPNVTTTAKPTNTITTTKETTTTTKRTPRPTTTITTRQTIWKPTSTRPPTTSLANFRARLEEAAGFIVRMVAYTSERQTNGTIKLPDYRHGLQGANGGIFSGVEKLQKNGNIVLPLPMKNPLRFSFVFGIPEGHVVYKNFRKLHFIPIGSNICADISNLTFSSEVSMDFNGKICRPSLTNVIALNWDKAKSYTCGFLSSITNPVMQWFINVWTKDVKIAVTKEIELKFSQFVNEKLNCETFRVDYENLIR